MAKHVLTAWERRLVQEAAPRTAALRATTEASAAACTKLQVLHAFLKAGKGQPGMLYALALTDEIYETLSGLPMPTDGSDPSPQVISLARDRFQAKLTD
jgi:hypothetical protein